MEAVKLNSNCCNNEVQRDGDLIKGQCFSTLAPLKELLKNTNAQAKPRATEKKKYLWVGPNIGHFKSPQSNVHVQPRLRTTVEGSTMKVIKLTGL